MCLFKIILEERKDEKNSSTDGISPSSNKDLCNIINGNKEKILDDDDEPEVQF
jgi:hypothetical protein